MLWLPASPLAQRGPGQRRDALAPEVGQRLEVGALGPDQDGAAEAAQRLAIGVPDQADQGRG